MKALHLLWALAWITAPQSALAQPPADNPSLDRTLDSLLQLVEFRGVALSPDGRRVAWVQAQTDKAGPSPHRSIIYVADVGAKASAPRRLTASPDAAWYNEQDVAWSPDGRTIAFLSDAAQKGQLQLYVADVETGRAQKKTDIKGSLAEPRFSPDGRSIALLFGAGAEGALGPLEAGPRQTGVIAETIVEQRIALVDLGRGALRALSPPGLYIYEYDWSPDGRSFAATGAHGSGDDNWWTAELFVIDAGSEKARSIYKPPMQIANPRFSPDGRSIAFIGGLMSDFGQTGGDIFVISAAGGAARNLTPGRKASASWLAFASGGRLVYTEEIDGEMAVASIDLPSGAPRTLWRGAETLHAGSARGLSLANDGETAACVRESFRNPNEVYAGPIGSPARISHANDGFRLQMGDARKVHWKTDGRDVQGWLLAPSRPPRPGTKAAMVVDVHGGPASAHLPGLRQLPALLSALGYYVFMPNPRGSYGQGEAFTRGNVKDFGRGDLRDILGGVAFVVAHEPVDERRIGVYGWSYGGFMTMWAVTQTNRFRAAVAGAGIANWQSYYGQNRIDKWMLPYFGASVYDDPQAYAKSSPIQFIKKVRTPTLVLVGERDSECPAPQSFEFWHALKTLGVPTELVVYADEGHAFRKPEHVRDRARRIVGWFDRYLAAANTAPGATQ